MRDNDEGEIPSDAKLGNHHSALQKIRSLGSLGVKWLRDESSMVLIVRPAASSIQQERRARERDASAAGSALERKWAEEREVAEREVREREVAEKKESPLVHPAPASADQKMQTADQRNGESAEGETGGSETPRSQPAGTANQMNRKQLLVTWITIGIIAVIFLIPPWRYHLKTRSGERTDSGPYRLILLGAPHERSSAWNAEVDWTRLLIPSGVVALVGSALVLTLRSRGNAPRRRGNGRR